MKVLYIDKIKPVKLPSNTALCLGNFDGIHLGHQELIKSAKRVSKNVAVMTFEPHPISVIKGLSGVKLLTPIDEKINVFENLGVDILIVVKFDINLMKMSKDEFIKFLSQFKFNKIVCGYDYKFAYMGSGDKDDLLNAFDTLVISKYVIDGIRVSSSKIRELLSLGFVEDANKLLGREYHIFGNVVHGNEMGRKIGFRTANVDYKDFYLPQTGVYLCKLLLDGNEYYGMANIGHNPTINLQHEIRLEVNIFEFDKDIYGQRLDVYFLERVRPEKKFNTVDDLIMELKRNHDYGVKKLLKGGN